MFFGRIDELKILNDVKHLPPVWVAGRACVGRDHPLWTLGLRLFLPCDGSRLDFALILSGFFVGLYYHLPHTCSVSTPDFVREIFFCTFADVEERPALMPRSPRGEGIGSFLIYDLLWQNLNQAEPVLTSKAVSVLMCIASARMARVRNSR